MSSLLAGHPAWLRWLSRLGLMTMRYDVAYKSDVGMKRLENQDVAEVYAFPGGVLGIVCDGMGGYSGGEVASRMAADHISQYFRNLPVAALRASADAPFVRLQEAIQWANQQIWDYAQKSVDLRKMGTTCVVVLCLEGQAYVAHVGDSRLYLLREHELMRVTRDHSRNQRLVDEGKLKAEEAEHHPGANVISRVLGQYRRVNVECQPAPIALLPEDRLLLCSDGLVRMVDDHGVLELLAQSASPTVICHQLIEAANQAGGKDNTTVQLLVCEGVPNQRMLWWLFLYCFAMLAIAAWGRWQARRVVVVPAPASVLGVGQSRGGPPALRQGQPDRDGVLAGSRRMVPPVVPPGSQVVQRLPSNVGQRLSNSVARTSGALPVRLSPARRRLRRRRRWRRRRKRRKRRHKHRRRRKR